MERPGGCILRASIPPPPCHTSRGAHGIDWRNLDSRGPISRIRRSVWKSFETKKLERSFKEAIAFAVSLTGKSDYGAEFHLREMRRLGLGAKAIREVIQVTQIFNVAT